MSAPPGRILPPALATVLLFAPLRTVRAEQAPPRLDHVAIPTAQSVDLTCDPEKSDYTGTVRVTLDVKQATEVLRFHTRALTVDSATLEGAGGAVKASSIEPLAPDQVRIRFAKSIAPGAYTLALAFHNAYNTHAISLYKVVTGGHAYLFTQFEDTEAREAFPCWDEPEFKIPWRMTLRVPAADLAVSNTPVASETRGGRARSWCSSPRGRCRPISSRSPWGLRNRADLRHVGAGPRHHGAGRERPRSRSRGTGRAAAEIAGALLRPALPYAKLDLIAAPEFLYGAMENAGAIVLPTAPCCSIPRRPAQSSATASSASWLTRWRTCGSVISPP
jgi:alanyl aminopeptidase